MIAGVCDSARARHARLMCLDDEALCPELQQGDPCHHVGNLFYPIVRRICSGLNRAIDRDSTSAFQVAPPGDPKIGLGAQKSGSLNRVMSVMAPKGPARRRGLKSAP